MAEQIDQHDGPRSHGLGGSVPAGGRRPAAVPGVQGGGESAASPSGATGSPFPRWEASVDGVRRAASVPMPDYGTLFMPQPGERREDYLDRLMSLQLHIEALIGATRRGLEAQRPAAPILPRPPSPNQIAPVAVPAQGPAMGAPAPAAPAAAAPAAAAPTVATPRALAPTVPPSAADLPVEDRRLARTDRRSGPLDRRLGLADRRRRLPDRRMDRVERRAGSPDRRTGPVDRRHGLDRRRPRRGAPALRFDRVTLFWAIQVVAWVAVAVVVLAYGLGSR